MDIFTKKIARNVFSSSLVFFVLSLLAVGTAAAGYRDQIPVPFSQIVWDHPDVSDWSITSDLHKVYISGDQLQMPHTKACDWSSPDGAVNANAWAIHKRASDNKWHANTWDFMRVCQTTKGKHDVGAPDGWRPHHGEEVYIFISGIIRPGYEHMRNVEQRTNIVKYYWESSVGEPAPSCSGPPVINSFTSSAATISKGKPVTLSWSIAKAESIKIITDTGKNINVGGKDPVADSITLSPEKTTTYIITADNCDNGTLPSSQVTVRVVEEFPFLVPLLLSSPVVTTAPASNIQDVSADLKGTVKTFGRDAVVAFEYGTTTSYGQTIAGTPANVNNNRPEEITATVTGLDQGTVYYFRLTATNGSRVFYGESQTFKTDDAPEASTDPATSVTSTGALLKGMVNPNGAETDVSFEFGAAAGDYNFDYYANESPVTGSGERQVSYEVTGLRSENTYYYRVRANNGIGGDVYGEEQSFTTPAAP